MSRSESVTLALWARIGLERLLDPPKRTLYRADAYAGLIGHDDQLHGNEEYACLKKKIVSKSLFEESDHEETKGNRESELCSKVKMFVHGLV